MNAITVPAWMLCVNGWGLVGRYHGASMDALRERMGSGWTLIITVRAWMLYGTCATDTKETL